MIFGADGARIAGQGQPNWTPMQFIQNLPNFIGGNQQALAYLQTNIPQLLTNPANLPALVSYFLAWQTYRVVNWTLRTLRFLVQMAPLLLPAFLDLASVNLGGLSGLAALAAQPMVPLAPSPPVVVATPAELPSPAMLLAAPAFGPTTSAISVSAAPQAAPVSAAPANPPAPAAGAEGFSYLIGGPGPGTGWGMRARIAAPDTTPDAAVAPAAATVGKLNRGRAARRLRNSLGRGYRYEFLDPSEDVDSGTASETECAPSEKGAGPIGFVGTALSAPRQPAGLVALAGDEFGGGPGAPMLPKTWSFDE